MSHEDSCTHINDYLTGFGKTLSDQFINNPIEPDCPRYNSYARVPLVSDYIISENDIIKTIDEIETSKASGIDFRPTFIINDAFKVIILQIAYMMNQSLLTGIFPDVGCSHCHPNP